MCRSKCLSPFEVFKKNYKDLMMVLPMNDDLFMAELYIHDLLPGNLKATLSAIPVSTTRASHFLDNAIMPSVSINDRTKFDVLLNVMKDCNNETVRNLGETISCMLNKDSFTDKAGKIDHCRNVTLYFTFCRCNGQQQ